MTDTTTWTGVGGKRVIITGATSGIGLAASKELVRRGAQLTIIARSQQRAERARADIGAADVLLADLACQSDIRRLAEEIQNRYARVEVLINNAGAMYTTRHLSPDGIELTWAVNHLAPFLLTNLLLEKLKASAPARIITTSSAAHYGAHIPFDDLNAERAYPLMGYRRYGETKLANVLFTRELARRLAGSGVTANCLHPGFVSTAFNANNGALMRIAMWLAHRFGRSPRRGAETLVWLADAPQAGRFSGGYFFDQREVRPSPAARDPDLARQLWRVSQQQTGVEP